MMSYEKLIVYQLSIEFLGLSFQLIEALPRGYSELADQLKRASMRIPLTIAEGAGKRTRADCRKYFDIARGSSMECGAILDVCSKLQLANIEFLGKGKLLLERMVAMLTKLGNSQSPAEGNATVERPMPTPRPM
jgi:four helix bundle protein